jgi:hypothetical protein
VTTLQTTIRDAATGKELPVTIDISEQGIFIGAKGYGEAGASRSRVARPIVIEFDHGELRVIVFSDINSEDPTSVINMMGARESNFKKEDE